MDVRVAIEQRRSIRQYQDRPVEEDKIRLVLDSGRLAPSGSNTQPCSFVLVRDPSRRQAVVEACNNQPFMRSAPVLIAILGDLKCRVEVPGEILDILDEKYLDERQRIIRDCAIAGQQMVLQAQELGLGTCWVGDFTQDTIRPVLGAPADQFVLAVLVLGYPAQSPAPRPRKALAAMVHYDRFGNLEK